MVVARDRSSSRAFPCRLPHGHQRLPDVWQAKGVDESVDEYLKGRWGDDAGDMMLLRSNRTKKNKVHKVII